MKANVLDTTPNNCTDAVHQASVHLSSYPVMGSGLPVPTISNEFTKTAIELGKLAKPEDCAECIGRKICRIYEGAPLERATPLYATHTNIITSVKPVEELHEKLGKRAKHLEELRSAKKRQEELAIAELTRGVSPDVLEEDLGLPRVDIPEAETPIAS
jgi:hypothetical protein